MQIKKRQRLDPGLFYSLKVNKHTRDEIDKDSDDWLVMKDKANEQVFDNLKERMLCYKCDLPLKPNRTLKEYVLNNLGHQVSIAFTGIVSETKVFKRFSGILLTLKSMLIHHLTVYDLLRSHKTLVAKSDVDNDYFHCFPELTKQSCVAVKIDSRVDLQATIEVALVGADEFRVIEDRETFQLRRLKPLYTN